MYCGIIYIPWGQFLWIVGFLLIYSGGCNFVDAPMSYNILIPRNIESGFNLLCDIINLGLIYRCEILNPPIKYSAQWDNWRIYILVSIASKYLKQHFKVLFCMLNCYRETLFHVCGGQNVESPPDRQEEEVRQVF